MGAKDSQTILESLLRDHIIVPVTNDALEDFNKDDFVVEVFRDNLFIGTQTKAQHQRVLEILARYLKQWNIRVGSGTIGAKPIAVLGFRVSSEGMEPLEANLQKILNA